MARDQVLCAIDVGSSKVVTVIASMTEDGNARIIGVSTTPSRGLRKSHIVNIEEATETISGSLESAERMAGTSVAQAVVSVGGAHISSLNTHGVVAIAEPDKEITQSDVRRVIDAAKAVQVPASREILHVLPRGFTVDGQEGIDDPVGMSGVRLEVETHLVTGGTTAVRNLYKCIEELGVDVAGVAFSGLASATTSLSETEKELGVVLVDIGGGTTDVAVFVDGALSYSAVIPIGAINITKDLAAGLRVSLESAEKIKLRLGDPQKQPQAPAKGEKVDEQVDISDMDLPEGTQSLSRKTLVEGIIKPRLNEIFTMVGLEIKRSGFGGMTPSGVVITGGGALTVGAVDAAKKNLAMPVHIGYPGHVSGLIDEIMTPAYTAVVGLLLWGHKLGKSENASPFSGIGKMGKSNAGAQAKGLAGKVVNLIKSFMP